MSIILKKILLLLIVSGSLYINIIILKDIIFLEMKFVEINRYF